MNGESRIPEYQHTVGHLECPACQKSRTLAMHATISPGMSFFEASQLWIESRTFGDGKGRHRYIAPRTLDGLKDHIKMLNRFFARLPLSEIHVGHMSQYQIQRSDGTIGNSGPNNINKETSLLIRILKRAHLWNVEMEECFEPLQKEESEIGMALSEPEQQRLLDTQASRKEWELVYWYSLLALNTTMHGCEIRGLKLGDVSLFDEMLYVRRSSAKNKYRQRSIPLTEEAKWALARIIDRARALGSTQPQHHIFPFRPARNSYDPNRPMSETGLKTPWEESREASGLKWLRLNDLRHTAITRLAENGTPMAVIASMAGHIGEKMQRHYTHIGELAKRRSLAASFGKRPSMRVENNFANSLDKPNGGF